jgi:hypothetical protein
MLDKLREVQHEELEEMEGYVSHVRQLADTRAAHLESEVMTLRSRLEVQQRQAATLASLLQRSGLESNSLPDDASPGDDNWVGEQVCLQINRGFALTNNKNYFGFIGGFVDCG